MSYHNTNNTGGSSNIITYIDGIPLFQTLQQALNYGSSIGLSGYHTHQVDGITGYMAGTTHEQTTNDDIEPTITTTPTTTPISTQIQTNGCQVTNCGECSEILSPYLIDNYGNTITAKKVDYNSSFGNYFFGDCICDPAVGYCKCCTIDSQNLVENSKTAPCQIIQDKFIEHHGIWRDCKERTDIQWDIVSGTSSCNGLGPSSEEYVGSFTFISEVDAYYETLDENKNINLTHFDLGLSPTDLLIQSEYYGWCQTNVESYIYNPMYRLHVNDIQGTEYDNYFECNTYSEFINRINLDYEGVGVDTTMSFKVVREKLIAHLNTLYSKTNSTYIVKLGIRPRPIQNIVQVTPNPNWGGTGKLIDTGIGCCMALNCPAKGKGCKCIRTTVINSGIVNCHCEGECGDKNIVMDDDDNELFVGIRGYRTVRFAADDISRGFIEAKSKGFRGTEQDIREIAGELINENGTINLEKSKFLSCKKCGGGIGSCAKGSCIGITCCPPWITITIPI